MKQLGYKAVEQKRPSHHSGWRSGSIQGTTITGWGLKCITL